MGWARLRRWNFWSWESTESGRCGARWPQSLRGTPGWAAWITNILRLVPRHSARRSKSGAWKLRGRCCPGTKIDLASTNSIFAKSHSMMAHAHAELKDAKYVVFVD